MWDNLFANRCVPSWKEAFFFISDFHAIESPTNSSFEHIELRWFVWCESRKCKLAWLATSLVILPIVNLSFGSSLYIWSTPIKHIILNQEKIVILYFCKFKVFKSPKCYQINFKIYFWKYITYWWIISQTKMAI